MRLLTLIVLTLCSTFSSHAHDVTLEEESNQTIEETVSTDVKKPEQQEGLPIAAKLVLEYLYLWTSTYVHEVGHQLAFQAFLDTSSTIHMSINPIKFFLSYGGMTIPDHPVSTKGWRFAAVCAAGPLVGALYCIAMRQASKLLPKNRWLDPITETIEKKTFSNVLGNLINLMPFALPNFIQSNGEPSWLYSDGYQIVKALR